MRSLLIAITIGFVALPSMASAQGCAELRRACEFKRDLGEQGQGNCRRYREQCQQPQEEVDCSALKIKCMYRDELGTRGQGNCRAYRENCQR